MSNAADLTIHKDSLELEKIDWEAAFDVWDEQDRRADKDKTPIEVEQLLFEHLYRKCTCGSGDVWSECNGFEGDSSYCG